MNIQGLLNLKWRTSSSNLVWVSTLAATILFNLGLFIYVASNTDIGTISGISILLVVIVVQLFITFLFFSVLTLLSSWLLKLFLVITTLINSIAVFYMANYNVVIDKTMIGNIFNTRSTEAYELLSVKLVLYVLILGIAPLWLLFRIEVDKPKRVNLVLHTIAVTIISIGVLYFNSSSWLWVDKYAKMLGGKILPWSYIINGARYYFDLNHTTEGQLALPDGKFSTDEKMLVVLVIGETARSDNFSLYGYEKPTTPNLVKQDNLVVLEKAQACTTYTTGSLACILSAKENNADYEYLPSYLYRHGTEVIWRTNNWGEPPIEVSAYQKRQILREICEGPGCMHDGVLLAGFEELIKNISKNKIFVVLHMKGSHGPSYYARYPKQFEKFKPVCREEEVSKCSQEELVNAYDNTIVYTDYFLSEIINKLNSVKDIPSIMIYVSDHGESLGEYGVYLHGTPYTFAPDFQKNIPFLIWRSDTATLKKMPTSSNGIVAKHGQYHVFHTILGAFDFDSPVYDAEKDVFKQTIIQ